MGQTTNAMSAKVVKVTAMQLLNHYARGLTFKPEDVSYILKSVEEGVIEASKIAEPLARQEHMENATIAALARYKVEPKNSTEI